MKSHITKNFKETKKIGKTLAKELKSGKIICLSGDLGAGKTTFTQGLLKGLKVKGPYTSPTFLIMKHYQKEIPISIRQLADQFPNKSQNQKSLPRRQAGKIQNIYHIDAYRIGAKDILNLGWEEIITDKNNIVIVEWAERIKKVVPKKALWIKFEWLDEHKRKITFGK